MARKPDSYNDFYNLNNRERKNTPPESQINTVKVRSVPFHKFIITHQNRLNPPDPEELVLEELNKADIKDFNGEKIIYTEVDLNVWIRDLGSREISRKTIDSWVILPVMKKCLGMKPSEVLELFEALVPVTQAAGFWDDPEYLGKCTELTLSGMKDELILAAKNRVVKSKVKEEKKREPRNKTGVSRRLSTEPLQSPALPIVEEDKQINDTQTISSPAPAAESAPTSTPKIVYKEFDKMSPERREQLEKKYALPPTPTKPIIFGEISAERLKELEDKLAIKPKSNLIGGKKPADPESDPGKEHCR